MGDALPPPTRENAASLVSQTEDLIAIRANREQIERLARLGALTEAQLEAGRKAGGLEIRLPARLVEEFRQTQDPAKAELERLARRIDQTGLNGPARLFLAANRPLSFFGSQILLLAQPVSKLAFGSKDRLGLYSDLLEDRHNVDWLLARLDELEAERRETARHLKKAAAAKNKG